ILMAALVAGLAQTRGLFAWRALGRRRRGDDDEALPLVAWATALVMAVVLLLPLRAVLAGGARARELDSAVAAALQGLASPAPRATSDCARSVWPPWRAVSVCRCASTTCWPRRSRRCRRARRSPTCGRRARSPSSAPPAAGSRVTKPHARTQGGHSRGGP